MKRFSISRLEQARQNPAQFGKSLEVGSSDGPRNFSKYMAWQLSLFKYHKTRNLSETINYFEAIYWRNFAENPVNRRQYEEYLQAVNAYISDHKRRRYTFVDGKVKFNMELSDKVKMTGQIPIVNMNVGGGYSIFFLNREAIDWDHELKYPVVQNFIANLFGVKLKDIEVGVYDLLKENHEVRVYSDRDVREAMEELSGIGRVISGNISS